MKFQALLLLSLSSVAFAAVPSRVVPRANGAVHSVAAQAKAEIVNTVYDGSAPAKVKEIFKGKNPLLPCPPKSVCTVGSRCTSALKDLSLVAQCPGQQQGGQQQGGQQQGGQQQGGQQQAGQGGQADPSQGGQYGQNQQAQGVQRQQAPGTQQQQGPAGQHQ
ncbi:hypothetical protein O9K51_07426 [Purpureocillium lavendulum]|uniref:Uncharacterized protein n=1 Tax=Purpureocillium lavendulum TaxID=1247861 RepID=A0AB34FJG7_9HYPO|nr:hypothetical protein O9K51_07426 [Purpureocillium lavendulum]